MDRGGSRAAAISKMEHFVIIVNGFQPLTIYHKALHHGCCSSLRSAFDDLKWLILLDNHKYFKALMERRAIKVGC